MRNVMQKKIVVTKYNATEESVCIASYDRNWSQNTVMRALQQRSHTGTRTLQAGDRPAVCWVKVPQTYNILRYLFPFIPLSKTPTSRHPDAALINPVSLPVNSHWKTQKHFSYGDDVIFGD